MRSIKLPILALITYSLTGCSVDLPKTDLCIANAPGQQLGCYNIHDDYQIVNKQLQLKPGAQKHYKPLVTIEDVNKWTCIDPISWSNAVAFLNAEQGRCTCQ